MAPFLPNSPPGVASAGATDPGGQILLVSAARSPAAVQGRQRGAVRAVGAPIRAGAPARD
ncbi:hypothetical protein [Arthrobacter sp. U41]|uniref:hypothetical protein n=1 Tax=Arthrobacter sp. U41 TaxID=1849032 RepID=UPI0011A61F3D|nr:hypothetical protein [Arthrobacter sp. U41]